MYKLTPTFALLLLLLVSACGDVLIDDLSNNQVELRAPVNGLHTTNQVQAFWWQELEDQVDGYRLEVVSPRFDSIAELVISAEITDATFYETTLPPGNYQWTVIGFNTRNETKPMIYDLVIETDSSMDLSNQSIVLVSPGEDMFTNDASVSFLWQELVGVGNYNLQVASPDFSNSTFFVLDTDVTSDFYTTTLQEGTYRWRVRAENDNSVSAYSSRSLTVDLSAPDMPLLTSPGFGDTLDLPVLLSWETDEDVDMSTLFVATDSLFTDQVLELTTSATSHSFSDNSATLYFWRVGTADAAGNESADSAIGKFYIQ